MAAASNVLIVGGGPSGLASAVALRRLGLDVEIAEINDPWRVQGSELSVGGSMLRALDTLGLGERVIESGSPIDKTLFCLADGTVVEELELPKIARPDWPAMVGITRAALHTVLSEAALAAGVQVRLGISVKTLDQDDDGVTVGFTDGSSGRYDFVVGADGMRSAVRGIIFPDAPSPRRTGQGVWRIRVPSVGSSLLAVYFGAENKAGALHVSDKEMYVFCVVNGDAAEELAAEDVVDFVRGELAGYGGLIGEARELITDPAQAHYAPLHALVLPDPWYNGRVLLVGDAAHATTPHMAYGAGIAVEDGVVLGETISSSASVADAFATFMERRYERCRMVVENGVQLGEWEQHPDDPAADPAGLTTRTWVELAQPI